ncbi:aminotransferase class I/II-fold pyridoxal phosphate-dependent enzyme [Chelativorans sp.]|uniref:pyridoxal phosphate-dependent aminotransferase n=1 Tax=Chelativorans sp. TaxID=2203393 RepID=UPI002810C9C9|nr:aminotransferase class I/II-fold pyridoxal phosphate-dependent enzyme [Chelativorans sp.]
MPTTSKRITGIMPSGKDGWEVHFAALARKQAGEDILMLSVGDHDFDTPAETVAACVAAVQSGHHHYVQLPGLPRLREVLARLSADCTGADTTPEEVIVTQGGQGALFAACQAVLDPGSHAIIMSPYYATYPGTVRAAGAAFTEIDTRPEDGFEPRPEAIEAAMRPETKMILVNSPNNPTGAVYSRRTVEAIAEICRRHDLWLVSDEVYWTLRAEREHVSARSLPGMKERTLVVNSLSKSHGMTGWRVGWLTAPADVIRHLTSLNIVSSYGMVDFVSRAAIAAVENGYGVAEIAERYAARRKVFLEAMHGTNNVGVRGSEGGMYVMLDISQVNPDAEAFAFGLLEAEKVAVMPGGSFGASAEGHLRVSMCQEEPVLREAAARIRRYIAAQAAQRSAAE